MSGKDVVKIIESELFIKDISKGEFYAACGLNSATISNWRNGVYTPSPAKLHVIEEYLGIKFEDEIGKKEPSVQTLDSETAELLEDIRNRQDLRILLNSARHIPPSSVYSLISQLEKEKERNTE